MRLKKCREGEDEMKSKKALQSSLLLLMFTCLSTVTSAQTTNLLRNPNADQGAAQWRAFGNATVEISSNNAHFVVRNGGYFIQDVELPEGSVGLYALLVGYGSSERINADGAITGLPYLYGYMQGTSPTRQGGSVLAYLEGQNLRAQTNLAGAWTTMSGIFQVPEGTKRITFFLNQALRKGVPHNGSAARFDNLGLYLFGTKEEAEAFLSSAR